MSSVLQKVLKVQRKCNNVKFTRSVSTSAVHNRVNNGILTSNFDDVDIPKVTIPEYVLPKMERFAKYTALECSQTGRKYTYEQIIKKARNFGKALRKKFKLEKGDVIAIYLPNVPEYPILTLGGLNANLVITTLNPLYTPEEISRQLQAASAKIIFSIPELLGNIRNAEAVAKQRMPIVLIKTKADQSLPSGTINFDELLDTPIDFSLEPASPDDLAFLPFSSGTTGLPKGVQLTHSNIVANLVQMDVYKDDFYIDPTDSYQDCIPLVLPMFHIYGFTVCQMGGLINGAKSITLSRFTPENYISVLKNNKISSIFAAPPLVLFLAAHPEVKPEYFESCRTLMSGAAPLGALDEERFKKKAPNTEVIQGYGLTETAPVVTTVSRALKSQFNTTGSIGKALPNTTLKLIAIDDPTGKPLGPNQSGELLVKGPQVMRGYHNNPEATRNTFHDGWLRTGDLMYYNDDGLLFVQERLKELIKVRGFQVAPAELEEIIRAYPNVADVAVIGVPHEFNGEVPRAYVTPKNKKDFNVEALQEFVAGKVAKYKQLSGGVEIIDAIPKNASGKILRRELKTLYEKNHL